MKKLMVIILLCFIALVGCQGDYLLYPVSQNKEASVQSPSPSAAPDEDKNEEADGISEPIGGDIEENNKVTYILEDIMIGVYNKDAKQWLSPMPIEDKGGMVSDETITFEDVLNKEGYYVYINDKYVREKNDILFPMSLNKTLDEVEGTEGLIALDESDESDPGEYNFSLPIKDTSVLDMPFPGSYLLVSFNLEEYTDPASQELLASTEKITNFFLEHGTDESHNIPELTRKSVEHIFEANNYESIEPFYRYCFQGDLDNDGNYELLIRQLDMGLTYKVFSLNGAGEYELIMESRAS